MAPDVNWVPVLTGWDPHDFIEMASIDASAETRV